MTNEKSESSANALKLGLFPLNIRGGSTMSSVPGTLSLDWPGLTRLARRADDVGIDLLVSAARWKGFGGQTNFAQDSFDTFTWAAGLAAVTTRARVMATVHVPTVHPVVAAKQLSTIDHISNGRAGINLVCGWFRPELEMFGRSLLEHDRRYDMADEWIEIVKRLMTESEPFDMHGEFYDVKDAVSRPHPVQSPCPPIMNAGSSGRGQQFAARWSDIAFVSLQNPDDMDEVAKKVRTYKDLAQSEQGRSIEVWTSANVTCADTEAAARARYQEVLEHGDQEAARNLLSIMGIESAAFGDAGWEHFVNRTVAGFGASPVVGDPTQVADKLTAWAEAGVDGVLMNFATWEDQLEQLVRTVLPVLEQRGLRQPAAALQPLG